ncbi:hypothetical protein BDM02DRAFT_3268325 [Thelephora ganbajun]|uniref:Uncharacterized protein n=1 Tax=Thelephora ganbajun TaxID=370292 RepID=A0ACB6ZK75_THEGA|nr:hypothetical protein BDM02DRAFT_3268325 [Thelephora ganbajun]
MGSSSSSPSRASTSVKHEVNNAVLSHFGSAFAGSNSFTQESIDKVTHLSRALYNSNKWISIRVDAVGTTSPALAICLVYGTGTIHKPGSAVNIGSSPNMAIGFSTKETFSTPTIDYETVATVIQNLLRTNLGSDVTKLQTVTDVDKMTDPDAGNIV